MGWFTRRRDRQTTARHRSLAGHTAGDLDIAGRIDGKHFTEYIERIKELKRAQRHDEAIELLLRCVDATEASSLGTAPGYYEQLAIIYRKDKRFSDEVAILERYARQPKSPGAGPAKLADLLGTTQDRNFRRFMAEAGDLDVHDTPSTSGCRC